MRPAKKNVVVENVMWDDGKMGEMAWHVFTAHEAEAGTEVEVIEDDAQSIGTSIGTSILFDHEEVHDLTNELEFETDDAEGEWETMSSSDESTHLLLALTTPPKVFLTRKNGEEFGNPRWSFAGKFNDHVLRRLASCKLLIPSLSNEANIVCSTPRTNAEGTPEASALYSDADCCRGI
jgi:hypothetical protein